MLQRKCSESIKMNFREIFDAARNNNISSLLRAKKEVYQIHNARNISRMMHFNDTVKIGKLMNLSREKIDSMLEDVRDNMEARKKAYALLRSDYIILADDLKSGSMLEEETDWRQMLYCAFCERYFDVESMEIEELYDRARIHRIRTIILEKGMENLFDQMSMEAKKIRLDTANINFLFNMLLEIDHDWNERFESTKKVAEECLKNRLWVNEGYINYHYFEKVEELCDVINHYYGREGMV